MLKQKQIQNLRAGDEVNFTNLFLDDFRSPGEVAYSVSVVNKNGVVDEHFPYLKYEWKVVRNFEEFRKAVDINAPAQIVSLDFDLCANHIQALVENKIEKILANDFVEPTGFDCLKYLIENYAKKNLPTPTILVHSMNEFGAERMVEYAVENGNF